MNLVNVKLRNGADLIGYLAKTDSYSIEVQSPISVEVSPQFGVFASNWLMFSEKTSVILQNHDFIYCTEASKRAIEYYEQFTHRHAESYDSKYDSHDETHDKLVAALEAAAVKYKH